jgi:Tol biopolymer transport system component
MDISIKHIRAVLLTAILTGAAGTACNITTSPTGTPSISAATSLGADSTTVQAQPTTAIPVISSPTPDLAATQAALATPIEEPFHLPGGRLLVGMAEIGEGRNAFLEGMRWLVLPDEVGEPYTVPSGDDPGTIRGVVWSPDYSHLVFVRETYAAGDALRIPQSRTIHLLGPDDTEPVQIAKPGIKGFIKGFSWSLDNRFVAFWNADEWSEFPKGNKNMHVYDIQSGTLKKLTVKAAQPGVPVLSPNGDRVAFANETYNPDTEGLYLINADGTGEQRLIEGAIFSPQWHPDGTRLIFEQVDVNDDPMTGPRHIYSVDIGSGVVTLLTPADQSSFWFTLSPDGRSLTYISEGSFDYGINVVGTEGGTPVLLTRGQGTNIVWSPDSQYVAYSTAGLYYILDIQGRGQAQIFPELELFGLVAWLP